MCYSLKFSRKGHVTLNSANQSLKFTIKSHFWWDLLFSPFHLKSIPLKSSAKKETAKAKPKSSKPKAALEKYIHEEEQEVDESPYDALIGKEIAVAQDYNLADLSQLSKLTCRHSTSASNGFLHYTWVLWFPEFSGYHQWQQESQ